MIADDNAENNEDNKYKHTRQVGALAVCCQRLPSTIHRECGTCLAVVAWVQYSVAAEGVVTEVFHAVRQCLQYVFGVGCLPDTSK